MSDRSYSELEHASHEMAIAGNLLALLLQERSAADELAPPSGQVRAALDLWEDTLLHAAHAAGAIQ